MSTLSDSLDAQLQALVPRWLVGAVEATDDSPGGATLPLVGSVLFVDVTGFSKLTYALFERKGADGFDQLARVLDGTFGPMVDLIEAYGGEVTAFVGDAVVAWWPVSPSVPKREAVELACRCSEAVQRQVEDAPPLEGVSLSIRQAVVVGELLGAWLGGGAHPRVYLLGGPAMRDIEPLLGRNELHRTLLSVEAVRAAGPRASLEVLPDGTGRLRRVMGTVNPLEQVGRALSALGPASTPDQARRYLDPNLVHRLENGQGGWVAEMRSVTAMFLHLHAPGPLSLDWLQPAMCCIQEVLGRHLGTLIEMVDDDKGLVVVAAFGLPAVAVFRPEAPAVAGLELAEGLMALGLRAGVGVATGKVFFGLVGSGHRKKIGLTGKTMNLAARLMVRGPGVRCDATTARTAAARVVFEPATPLDLKGFADPVHVSTALRTREEEDGELVGRRSELQRVQAGLEQLAEGVGGLLVFGGEPGIGKTALLAAARRRARQSGVDVLRLAGSVATRDVPYRAWRPLLRAVIDARSDEDVLALLEQALGDRADLAPLLGPALGMHWPDNPSSAQVRGFLRPARTADLITRLMTPPEEGQGRVLAVEDGQWLDGTTLTVLERLAEARTLVVFVARTGTTEPSIELRRLLGMGRTMGAMSPADIGALAQQHSGMVALPDGLAAWLHRASQGHPFFALELLANVRERGLLQLDEQGRVLFFDGQALEATPAPTTVEAALGARLDRLPAETVLALKVASAVGARVDREALSEVWEQQGHGDLDAALMPARQEGLLVQADDGALRFDSATVRKVVHGSLVRDQRHRIHGALADHFQGRWSEERRAHAAELAWHLGHAGRPAAAIEALGQAHEDASKAGVARAASRLGLRALALDEEAQEQGAPVLDAVGRARWHERVAQGCRGFGDTDTAFAQLLLAAEALNLTIPESRHGWQLALLKAGVVHLIQLVLPRKLLQSANQELVQLHADVLGLMSLAYYFRAQNAESLIATALRAANTTTRCSRPVRTAIAYSMLGVGFSALPGLSQRYLDLGRTQADGLEDPRELLDAALGQLMVNLVRCRWRDGERLLVEVMPLIQGSRSEHLGGVFLGLAANINLMQGQAERAAGYTLEMIEVAEQQGYVQARGWARNIQVTLAMFADDHLQAQALAEEAWAILDQRKEPDRFSAMGMRAVAILNQGDLARALAVVDELEPMLRAEQLMSATGLESYSAVTDVRLAALAQAPQDAALRKAAAASLGLVRSFSRNFYFGRPRYLQQQGEYQRLTGSLRKAGENLGSCVQLSKELGMPHERARALISMAALPMVSESQRRELLSRVTRIRAGLALGWRALRPEVEA